MRSFFRKKQAESYVELESAAALASYQIAASREAITQCKEALKAYPKLDKAVGYYWITFCQDTSATGSMATSMSVNVMERFITNPSNLKGEYYKDILTELNRLFPAPAMHVAKQKLFHFFLMPMYTHFLPCVLKVLQKTSHTAFPRSYTNAHTAFDDAIEPIIEQINKSIFKDVLIKSGLWSFFAVAGIFSTAFGIKFCNDDPASNNDDNYTEQEEVNDDWTNVFRSKNFKGYTLLTVGGVFLAGGATLCISKIRNYYDYRQNFLSWKTFNSFVEKAIARGKRDPLSSFFTLKEIMPATESEQLLRSSSLTMLYS